MAESISCIIVDDDEIDRLATLSFVRRYPFLNVVGVYAGSQAALQQIETVTPDVLFLDIDMPDMTGLELREKIQHIPACIFITAFPEHAVESFEKDALDFLVKPLKQDRFEKMIERLQEYLTLKSKAALLDNTLGGDTVFIKEGHERIKLHIHNILYLEALKDYTRIVTASRKYCVLSSLGNLLKEDSFRSFIRVHRSFAVQKQFVQKVTSTGVTIQDKILPVGRVYKDMLADLS